MEIVQTGIDTWPWCMSMIGARFAVFVRRAQVLPGPCQSVAFWQCKILYDCYENENGVRDPLAHRENFCNGCGTSQTTEERFYEELDCGGGSSIGIRFALVVTFVVGTMMFFV